MRKSDASVKAKTESYNAKDEDESVTPRRSGLRLKSRPKGPPGLPKGISDKKQPVAKAVDITTEESKKVQDK